jgi:transaldolase
MKIFLDTADTFAIRDFFETGLIDGVTTNPTIIAKSGRVPDQVYQKIKEIGLEDISMEVMGTRSEMYGAGRKLHTQFGQCATIKVPCTPDGLSVCKALSEENIRVNVTLIFSSAQAILAAKAGATYVSPFIGRVDDNSFDGVALVKEISTIYREHLVRTQILAASVRTVRQVTDAFVAGADLVTLPPSIFQKMYNHILTDKGLELFDADAKNIKS